MNTKNSREEDSCGKLDFASKLQRRASDTRLFILRLVWSLLGCDTNLVQVTVVSEKYATSSSGQTMMEIYKSLSSTLLWSSYRMEEPVHTVATAIINHHSTSDISGYDLNSQSMSFK